MHRPVGIACRYDSEVGEWLDADEIRAHWTGAGFLILASRSGGFGEKQALRDSLGGFLDILGTTANNIESLGSNGGIVVREGDEWAHLALVEDEVLIMIGAVRPENVKCPSSEPP